MIEEALERWAATYRIGDREARAVGLRCNKPLSLVVRQT